VLIDILFDIYTCIEMGVLLNQGIHL